MLKRRIFNLLCLASPLVFAVLVACWARSYYYSDGLSLRHGRRDGGGKVLMHAASLIGSAGCVGVRAGRWWEDDSPSNRSEYPDGLHPLHEAHPLQASGYPVAGTFWNRVGFLLDVDRFASPTETENAFTLIVPYWLPIWLAAVPPAWWVSRRRRERGRRRIGLCVRCGYDIRATPQRCPECGLEAKRSAP